MDNQKTLSEIIKKFQELELKLIDSDGEISQEIEKLMFDNEVNLSKKLDGYEKFSRYLKGQVDYLKSIEEQYNRRRKVLDNSIKKIKDRMLNAMLITGKEKIKSTEFNYSIGNSEKWGINQENMTENIKQNMIDMGLAENVFKANISEIKNKYKNNDIPDWLLIEKNKYIRVK